MSDALRLMGVGVASEEAIRAGFQVQTVTSATGLKGPGNLFAYANADAITLQDTTFNAGDIVFFIAATACSVSPGTSAAFLSKTTGSALAATANYAKIFVKNVTVGTWTVFGLTA